MTLGVWVPADGDTMLIESDEEDWLLLLFLEGISSSSSVFSPPLMCIDIPLGSTTTLELGLDGLVTLVTVPLTGVGGLEEVLPVSLLPVLDGLGMAAFFSACRLAI